MNKWMGQTEHRVGLEIRYGWSAVTGGGTRRSVAGVCFFFLPYVPEHRFVSTLGQRG